MFGLSMWEIIVIIIVILFVVGPKRLPDVAKSLGKGYGEFKRTFNEMKKSVNINDDIMATPKSKPVNNENKIQTYAEQYKSQWEEKFDDNSSPTEKVVSNENNNENTEIKS